MLSRNFTTRRTSSQSSTSSNQSNTPPSDDGYYADNSQNVDDDFDYNDDTNINEQVIVPVNSIASQATTKLQSDVVEPIQETDSFNPDTTQLIIKTDSTIIKNACSIAIILPLVIGSLIPLVFTIDSETIDFSILNDGEKLEKLLDLKKRGKINGFTFEFNKLPEYEALFSSPRIRINDYIINMFPDLDEFNVNYNVLIFNIKYFISNITPTRYQSLIEAIMYKDYDKLPSGQQAKILFDIMLIILTFTIISYTNIALNKSINYYYKKEREIIRLQKKQQIQQYINLFGFSFAFQIFSINDQDRMEEIQRQEAAAANNNSNTNIQSMITNTRRNDRTRNRRRSRNVGGKPQETLKIEFKLCDFKKLLHQTCLLFFKPKGAKIVEDILLETLSHKNKLSKSKSKYTRKSKKSNNSKTRKKPPSQ